MSGQGGQGGQGGQDGQGAAPYALAGLTFAIVLAIYVATIAPTTQFWDTSEYIAAAKVLGIPHPPGNPLFVLVANVWGRIPLVEHYALRINLLAAVTSALASALLVLVAERFLRHVLPEPCWLRRAAAFAGTLVGATSFTVWNQAVVNEKVYTLSLMSIALVLWLTVRWGDEPPGQRRDHWLILIAYLLALTTTNHLMGLLVGPAVAMYVLQTDPAVFRRWRMWLAVVAVCLVGFSVYVFLPLRAGHFPAINEGEPTTWEALRSVLSREQYLKPPVTQRQADIVSQYANYLQYFTWQFGYGLGELGRKTLAVVFGLLGLLGAFGHWRCDRRGARAMTALMLTVTVLLVFYLNFKYGYSMRPGETVDREVRERDYFFIASFQLWGVWVALGFGVLIHKAGEWLRRVGDAPSRWHMAAPVLLFALLPLVGNIGAASRAGETAPRTIAVDLLESVEPYGILVTAGDNDTFPLWYAQEVEGVRRDVTVANLSLMNTTWHVRQLKRRGTVPFDTVRAALPAYREPRVENDTVLAMSFDDIEQLPPIFPIDQPRLFRAGPLRAALVPERLPNPGYLEQADIVTLQLIQDNLGKRPIYFSRTIGGYPDDLGLGPMLMGHGLARKLMPDTIQAAPGVVRLPVLGWVDVERTRALLFDVYDPASVARPRPFGWIDDPSGGTLALYGLVYQTFGEHLQSAGDSAQAADAIAIGRTILRQTGWSQ